MSLPSVPGSGPAAPDGEPRGGPLPRAALARPGVEDGEQGRKEGRRTRRGARVSLMRCVLLGPFPSRAPGLVLAGFVPGSKGPGTAGGTRSGVVPPHPPSLPS